MLIVIGAVFGALMGAIIAKRRKGVMADILQYATVYCLLFAIIGLMATLTLARMAL